MARRFYLPQRTSFRTAKAPRRLPIPQRRTLLIALAVLVAGGGLCWLAFFEFTSPTAPRMVPSATRVPIGSSVQDSERTVDANSVDSKSVVAPAPVVPADRVVRIQLMNGCGVKGLAQRAASALRARGFDVRETRNAPSNSEPFTRINDRIGNILLAQRVADSLGVDYSHVGRDTTRIQPDIDVTVILGMDYDRLKIIMKPNSKE